MSAKFAITKTHSPWPGWWFLHYPPRFSASIGMLCPSFEDAVEQFIEASERRCPYCDRGAVVDTDWGWECRSCGSSDVAVGCERPK